MDTHLSLFVYLQRTKQVTRRDFMDMIREEVMRVNNDTVTSWEQTVTIGDTIQITTNEGVYEETIHHLPHQGATRVILFHKPSWYVVSKNDPHNKTIYDILPERRKETYWYVGRLDKDSTWLQLLTNNPRLVDYYEQPQNRIFKVYEVEINKPLKSNHAVQMKKGIWVTQEGEKTTEPLGNARTDDELLSCVRVAYHGNKQARHLLTVVLQEGKKRHIRRLLQALGYKVRRLHRVQVGKRQLGAIKPGKRRTETVKGKELRALG